MFILDKKADKDFTVLNIADLQLVETEITQPSGVFFGIDKTIRESVARVKPDMLTCSGDIAYGHDIGPYEYLEELFDSFRLPFSVVWGNHDNEGIPEYNEKRTEIFRRSPYFRFDPGDPSLGHGNYVVAIRENGKIVSAVIMMDSHNQADFNGSEEWAKLWPEQLVWYEKQVEALRQMGCDNSVLMMHIPIYAYRTVVSEAIENPCCAECHGDGVKWKPGYENSIGCMMEGVCSYPEDEGAFDVIERLGHTKCIIVGHDHVNNIIIDYHGVKFVYTMKTGTGCYCSEYLNGTTAIHFDSKGFKSVEHIEIPL